MIAGARIARLALVASVLASAQPAAAHPLDVGYLRIAADGATLAIRLDLDATAAAHLLDTTWLDAAALSAHAAQLAAATLHRAPIATERGACAWTTAVAELVERTASVTVAATCPSGFRTLRWPLAFVADDRVSPVFQLLVKARLAGGDRVTTLDRTQPVLELSLDDARAPGFGAFVWSGIEHIGAAPSEWRDTAGWRLPDGIDHILFLLALVLSGGTLLQLAGVASGFTLGHSITLALSGLGLLRPPAAVIEPLIALSIALVAAQALLRAGERHRWQSAAAFGLIHGFGFAGALHELELSSGELVTALLGYNTGVEVGQLAIVAAIAPLILVLQRRPRLHRAVVRACAAAICAAGLYWFVQRICG